VISHAFIDRPIFASVVSIVVVVMGLLSMQFLPVAQFPEITPPVVQIDADYPGASAEVAAEAVARPIEVTLPGVEGEMGIYPMHIALMTQVAAGEIIAVAGWARILINAENGCLRVIFTVVGSIASVLAIFLYRL